MAVNRARPSLQPGGPQDIIPALRQITAQMSAATTGCVPHKSVSGGYQLTLLDMQVVVTGAAASVIHLPTASSAVVGGVAKTYIVINSTPNNITIQPIGTAKINGGATLTVAAGSIARITTDGTNWYA